MNLNYEKKTYSLKEKINQKIYFKYPDISNFLHMSIKKDDNDNQK